MTGGALSARQEKHHLKKWDKMEEKYLCSLLLYTDSFVKDIRDWKSGKNRVKLNDTIKRRRK